MAADTPQPVIDTKFMVPTLPGDYIPRNRLRSLLSRIVDFRLTVLCGSSGFGKTSVLCDYVENRLPGIIPVWISLDREEDQLDHFWYYVASGFGIAISHMEGLASSVFSHTGDIDFFLAGLINRIAREPGRFVLVLDDFHLMGESSLMRSVAFFIEHLPGNLHVVISSRLLPPLPLSRWRGKGWICELDEEELRFTDDEARNFLKGNSSGAEQSLTDEIVKRTEGWIVGLRLALISLQRGFHDIEQVLHGISGRERYIDDYLSSEIFGSLDEEYRLFLVSTSIACPLTAELCDYLMDWEDSSRLIRGLEEIRFFIIPLGKDAFRYHHLLREFLMRQLMDQSPPYYRELNRKAALWYERRSDYTPLIHHLIEAEEYEKARDVILGKCADYMSSGEMGILIRFIEDLPEAVIVRSRPLMVWYAWSLASYYRMDEAEKWLIHLANYCDDTEEGLAVRGGIAAVKSRLACMGNDDGRCLALAGQALELMPQDNNLFRADLEMNLAGTFRHVFEYEKAVSSYLKAAESAWAVKNIRTGLSSAFYCSWIYQDMGKMTEARRLLDAAGRRWGTGGNITCWLDLGRGHIDYEEGHLEDALENLEKAREKASLAGDLKPEVYAECSLALLYHSLGEEAKCEEAVNRIQSIIECSELDKMADYAGVWIAHLRFLQGRALEVSRWIALNPVEESMPEIREWAGLIHLEFGAAANGTGGKEKDPGQVGLETLRLNFFREKHLSRECARDMMALAVAEAGKGNLSPLPRALEAAQESHSVAVAAEQLALIPNIEKRGYFAPLRRDYRERLRAWLDRAPHPDADLPGHSVELYEQLSPREREILGLIGSGESNREIAGTLFVSPATVKWHVKNILAKLGVGNRTAAVARARELGLLGK